MRAFRALRWVALGMAIGGLTFGAVTARAANKLDNQPFSGVLTGTSTGTPSSVTIVGSVSSGSINATHLGNGTYTLTVTDTMTGHVKVYQNPSGRFASTGDTLAF